jgi:hypothetical protein
MSHDCTQRHLVDFKETKALFIILAKTVKQMAAITHSPRGNRELYHVDGARWCLCYP